MKSKIEPVKELAGRLAVAICIALGISFLWSMAGDRFLRWERNRQPPSYRDLVVTKNGDLYCEIQEPGDGVLYRWEGLDGKLASPPIAAEVLRPFWLSAPKATRKYGWDYWLFRDSKIPMGYWSLVMTEGRAYFVGYDAVTNRRLGFLTIRGFCPSSPTSSEMFPLASEDFGQTVTSLQSYSDAQYHYFPLAVDRPGPWVTSVFLNAGSTIYRIDLDSREVTAWFSNPQVEDFDVYEANETTPAFMIVRTSDRLLQIPLDEGKAYAVPIPPPARDKQIAWYVLDDGQSIVRGVGPGVDDVYRIDANGKIAEEHQLSLGMEFRPNRLLLSLLQTPEPARLILDVLRSRSVGKTPQNPFGLWQPNPMTNREAMSVLLPVLVAAFLLGTITYRREQTFGGTKVSGFFWGAFVFLGGLPAFCGYLTHRTWPAKVVRMELAKPIAPPTKLGTELYA